MADNYSAFISYRHSEVDSRVARLIQHDLEHFVIPKAIRKNTGSYGKKCFRRKIR